MPFLPGRKKTGGRTKNSSARRSSKFVEQLKGGGFDYVRELASALKMLKELVTQPVPPIGTQEAKNALSKSVECKNYYSELKSLLPYMAPKLREADVVVADEPETPGAPQAPLSDDELLKAVNGSETPDKPRASNPPAVAARDSGVQVPASTEKNLLRLAGEQEEDS